MTNAELVRALGEAKRQISFYKREARPGLFKRASDNLPLLAGAVVLGAVAWEIVR
jgi:hypothetical protein